jgi:hypothetical protein
MEMLRCERQLARWCPEMARVSLDRLLPGKLRARAAEDEIDWRMIREADGASCSRRRLRPALRGDRPAGDPGSRSRGIRAPRAC